MQTSLFQHPIIVSKWSHNLLSFAVRAVHNIPDKTCFAPNSMVLTNSHHSCDALQSYSFIVNTFWYLTSLHLAINIHKCIFLYHLLPFMNHECQHIVQHWIDATVHDLGRDWAKLIFELMTCHDRICRSDTVLDNYFHKLLISFTSSRLYISMRMTLR